MSTTTKPPDPNYFNNRAVWGSMPYPNTDLHMEYKASEFWSDIKKNLYLTPESTRKSIKEYLEIKSGSKTWLGETDSGYKRDLKGITDAVEERYKELTKELDELEK